MKDDPTRSTTMISQTPRRKKKERKIQNRFLLMYSHINQTEDGFQDGGREKNFH